MSELLLLRTPTPQEYPQNLSTLRCVSLFLCLYDGLKSFEILTNAWLLYSKDLTFYKKLLSEKLINIVSLMHLKLLAVSYMLRLLFPSR